MNKILPVLVIILILAGLGGILYFSTQNSAQLVSQTENPPQDERRVYQNETHGYSLSLPGTLDIREYSPDNVVFGQVEVEEVNGVVEARVIEVQGQAGRSIQEVVSDQLITLCAADGPTTSFSCTGVEQQQPLSSESGVEGFVVYLTGELTNLETQEVTERGKGPFFVFPLSSSATMSKVVVIHPPLNLYASEADSEQVREVAMTFQIEESQTSEQNTVEQYVSENISELSPVNEQLGGTFYVTRIDTENGTGMVEYEDGHNAYIADFTYERDEQGNVSITYFDVRE